MLSGETVMVPCLALATHAMCSFGSTSTNSVGFEKEALEIPWLSPLAAYDGFESTRPGGVNMALDAAAVLFGNERSRFAGEVERIAERET